MLKSLLFGVLSLAACGLCSASTLYVSDTGTFSSLDTADALVSPGSNFNLSFVVNSNPVISSPNYTNVSFDVPITNFSYTLNGSPVASAQPTEITFYTAADGGGFAVQFASAEFILSSSQYFTGATSAPVFSPNTFASESFLFLDNNNGDTNSSVVTLTATPEPSSLLLLCGGIGLIAARLRHSARN